MVVLLVIEQAVLDTYRVASGRVPTSTIHTVIGRPGGRRERTLMAA